MSIHALGVAKNPTSGNIGQKWGTRFNFCFVGRHYSPPNRKRNPARKFMGRAGYPTTSL